MKPSFDVNRITSSSTGGAPLYYDQTGITYDLANLYYDRWYNIDNNLTQGEMPTISMDSNNDIPKIRVEED